MTIYLIRHGETALNRERVLQHPDTPLSERGISQARRMANRLRDAGITRILASDQARAATTAAVLGEQTGLAVEYEPLLVERDFGEIRGTPYSELPENPFGERYAPPGGESWADFHARVDRTWTRVVAAARESAGHLAVVSHGLVLHSIAARFLELPAGVDRPAPNGPPLRFGNTAVTIVDGPVPWRAVLLGCTAHLEGETADDAAGISGL